MSIFIDLLDGGPAPKRGDLVQTNIGNRRERTWFVLRARRVARRASVPRYQVWMVRWWQIEPVLRWRLYLSAERNGGQAVHHFHRYPAKKKRRPFDSFDC